MDQPRLEAQITLSGLMVDKTFDRGVFDWLILDTEPTIICTVTTRVMLHERSDLGPPTAAPI